MSYSGEKKVVNALIPEAEMGFATSFILDAMGASGPEAVLEVMKKLMGGLWVGGVAIIQENTFDFRPNLLNRLVHKAEYIVQIPFTEVIDVKVRFGFFTKIIDVMTNKGKLSVRCYGAESFARKIRDQKMRSVPVSTS